MKLGWLLLAALGSSAPAVGQEIPVSGEGPVAEGNAIEEGQSQGYVYVDAPLVRERLEDVLRRPEFARLRSEPEPEDTEEGSLPEWLDRLADWLGSLFGRGGDRDAAERSPSFGVPGWLLLAMPAAILVAALVFVGRAMLRTAQEKKVDREEEASPLFGPGAAPGEMSPALYWQRAQELADRRDYKGAIRQLLLAAMSTLERRGLVRFRKGLTNRDYLHAARGPSRASLDVVVRQFEHVYFGRREATSEGYSECRRQMEKGFPLETP